MVESDRPFNRAMVCLDTPFGDNLVLDNAVMLCLEAGFSNLSRGFINEP